MLDLNSQFIVPPDPLPWPVARPSSRSALPSISAAPSPDVARLEILMRRRIEEGWHSLDPRGQEKVLRAFGGALARICGVSRDKLAGSRGGVSGITAILDQVRATAEVS